MKAIWNGVVLAESTDTVIVERNHYFPVAEGRASYYDVVVGEQVNADAAWYYPSASDAAKNIEGRIAFWKGVEVRE